MIGWGIIGCGDVTEVKSGPAFSRVVGSDLVAVMRRNGSKARDYAKRHGVPHWYDDAAKLIDDPEVNAVYIATPPDSHAKYTLQVAAAGKAVYVEKPMARTSTECGTMVSACAKAGVALFVAYYRRRLPLFLKARELIASGALGEVRFATIELFGPPAAADRNAAALPWRVVPEIAGNGYFYDLGSHQLDLLDYLLGPVFAAEGCTVNQAGLYEAADAVSASLSFKSGAVASGLWCFTAFEGNRSDRTHIVGTRGKLTYSTFDLEQPLIVETEGGTDSFHLPPPAHVQEPLIQSVTDHLLGRGTCPSTGVSAARTNAVLEQIAGTVND